jgi:leucyl aminopeptidase
MELHISLRGGPAPDAAPHAIPLASVDGVSASVTRADSALQLGLALTALDTPTASLRWQVDRVLRRFRQTFDVKGLTPTVSFENLPRPVAEALALDLARAHGPSAVASFPGLTRLEAAERHFRSLVNADPAACTSLALADEVRAYVDAYAGPGRMTCEVLDEPRLREERLNLLLAVGQASEASPPRLIVARHDPAPSASGAHDAPWMLLGKGITFDTGGINTKPYDAFVSHMRNDMAGAALALALFRHLVETGFPRPVVLVLPTCENAVGEKAIRPGTVVRTRNGKTVKIDHTDAEGRLVLADGLVYATERHQPALTWCFATLTTAALSAYGPFATPVHFAEGDLARALTDAADRVGDDVHLFPRRPWHFEANRDSEADLRNTARLGGAMPASAGSRNAAHFFLHFATSPFVHADIFASAWNWGDTYPGAGFGATGAPFRLFAEAFARLA